MTLTLLPISETSPEFGAEVEGIDLRETTSANDVAQLEAGMDKFAVLIFRRQFIGDDDQLAFTRNFGSLLNGANMTKTDNLRLNPAFADVSNLDTNNNVLERNDRRRAFSLGNRLWHSDASFRATPARYSLLSGRVVPPSGGNTEFADMRAAYESLTDDEKLEVENLRCFHSLLFSRSRLGFNDYTNEERSAMEPVRQPLIRIHPVTGRKSLFLSAHVGAIDDWLTPEALIFLSDLTEHATQRRFVYSHVWRAGDLVMWDNRQTMHRSRRFDDLSYTRDMRRTTTIDDIS
jgi:alpha-ketoglutarate-dependent 2,4-dichlorophenoxyacetate dioxygenase